MNTNLSNVALTAAGKHIRTLSEGEGSSVDTDMGIRPTDITLMQLILRGSMIVWENDRALLVDPYHGGPIDLTVTQYVKKGDYKIIQGDERLVERTLHLGDEWAGDKDSSLLRRCLFSRLNQAALDNAYRTEQVIQSAPVDRTHAAKLSMVDASKIHAVENVIDVGQQMIFDELDLAETFKFADDDDKLVLAMKVGASTALVGLILDDNRRAIRTADVQVEKIRLKKNTLVCRILPRIK